MNPLYNTGIRAYRAAARLAALRSEKVDKMVKGQRDALAHIRLTLGDHPQGWLWIHVSSLGEFEQARPLIERIKAHQPEQKILLTFFSPSGYEVRKNYPMVDCVAYLPMDTPANARAFVEAVNPRMAIFVKYEFWGNYLEQLYKHGIPIYIISTIFRPTQSFFRWWGGMFRGMLRRFRHFYVQDEASKRLLASIGIDNVTVAGDTRFDRVTDVMRARVDIPSIHLFGQQSKMRLVMGSSWPADEDIILPWLKANPEVAYILAPHEFDSERIEALLSSFPGPAITLSRWMDPATSDDERKAARGIVVDSFGKLSSLYRYGNVAYIGGGFGAGIHNLNEAAVYGMPVVFGPNNKKFKEAADLASCGGGFPIASAEAFADVASRLLAEPELLSQSGQEAKAYIERNLGASDLIFADLFGKSCEMRDER